MKFLKRLTVLVLFIPAMMGWLFLFPFVWLVTGDMQEPWPARLINWATVDDAPYALRD